jgi:hypothetical protein
LRSGVSNDQVPRLVHAFNPSRLPLTIIVKTQ